jgi:hypothetical protein
MAAVLCKDRPALSLRLPDVGLLGRLLRGPGPGKDYQRLPRFLLVLESLREVLLAADEGKLPAS